MSIRNDRGRGLVLLILIQWFCFNAMGAIKSTTGSIIMDAQNDGSAEAILNATGLSIGKATAASANLDVSGNAIISGSLSVGSNNSPSSGLSIQGSYAFSHETVSDNTTLDTHSYYFTDSSQGNIILQLPPAETSQGRKVCIKRSNLSGDVTLGGGLIEDASSLTLPAGKLTSLSLINSANIWRIVSRYDADSIISSRKVFHALLDESSPDSPVDSVNGVIGIHKNMASANIGVSANIGLGCDLDGDEASTTGDFITFEPGGASEGIYDLQLFTLSARIYPRTPLHTNHQAIIKRGGNETLNYRFTLNASDMKLYLRVTFFDESTLQTSTTTVLTPGQWYHVVGVHDGSNLQIYIDGVADGSPVNTGGRALVQGGDKGLDIGGSGGGTQNLNGIMDDIRLYNYGLSAAQVLQLYQGTFD
ncbi:MAG: LamG domain-containing protein [Planctomycetes bacterium]|nr:LamG domain-containing protein [Planctomycetota bacterium]